MPTHPYIGITGFTNHRQVGRIALLADLTDRPIMCGVVLSKARIRGEPSDRPNRYPPLADIPGIFSDRAGCLNIIHFRPQLVAADALCCALQAGGPHCHGIQINTTVADPWPDPREIVNFRQAAHPRRIILQISGAAIRQQGNDVPAIAQACSRYRGVCTDLLIDQSGGTGNPDRMDETLAITRAVAETCPDLTVGIAGGLSHENVARQVRQAAQRIGHHRFSIDAEGGLRNPQDQLATERAVSYVEQAISAFRELNP